MDDDSESDFYGDEDMISSLEARVSAFSPARYRLTHPTPNPISLRLTPKLHSGSPSSSFSQSHASSSLSSGGTNTITRLHNPYSNLPQCARQLTESVDSFLRRLPPATTTMLPLTRPWIYIANPYIPPAPPSDLPRLAQGGTERLELFTKFCSEVTARIKSPFAAKQQIAKERKEVISDLKELAVAAGDKTGKWMLFPEPCYVNDVWATVARATANNELGTAAKVAPRPEIGSEDARLICVYTADFSDKDDVARVLKRLRELGLVRQGNGARQIYYKCDAWTYLNLYGGNEWNIPGSIYSSNEIFEYLKGQAATK